MKKLLKSLFLGIGIVALYSCIAESGYLIEPKNNITLAKQEEIFAYSKGVTLNEITIVAISIQNQQNYWKIQDYNPNKSQWSDWEKENRPDLYKYIDNAPSKTDRGESVSTSEMNYVLNWIHNHKGSTECDLSTYFIQNVGSHGHIYQVGPDRNGVYNTTGMNMDYFMIDGAHVPDYNAQGGPRALLVNIPLQNLVYHDSYGTVDNFKENAFEFYYITLPEDIDSEDAGKTCLYVGFDYRTTKEGNFVFNGDNIYDDWVIKIIPADSSLIEIPDIKEPSDTIISSIKEHVEINLEVENHQDWTASHLSIHVRANTDVEVFIPITPEYYCDVDDLAIVQKHKEDFMIHGGPTRLEYNINENLIYLNVKYLENGIKIWTEGINEEIIDYMKSNFNDGITFEIWNYYTISEKELRDLIKEGSIVTFKNPPELYINAYFFEDNSEEINSWDCKVEPIQNYQEPYKDYWYNNSPYNDFYKR